MDLDLRLVRYAVALADELHFGRAATKLLIAEQTLSGQIKQLEKRLGVALFTRDRRGVELTDAGVAFIRRGRRLLADTDDLLDEVRSVRPTLRVDVLTEGVPPNLVAEHLRRALPQWTIEIMLGQGLTAALPRVVAGDVELAFGWAGGVPGGIPTGLEQVRVCLDPVAIVLPVDHPLTSEEEVRLSDLRGLEMLIHAPSEAAEWQRWQEEAAEAFGMQVMARLHGHGQTSAHIAVATYGVAAFGPADLGRSQDVVARPLTDPVPMYVWSMFWRTQRDKRGLRDVVDMIHEFSVENGWLVPPERAWWVPESDRDLLAGEQS